MKKYVYAFEEGKKEMKSLLGGKGANLAEMSKIGLPVPPGFTITTEACIHYIEIGEKLEDSLKESIFEHLSDLEDAIGKDFGDVNDPLLVSVRSGAVISMPGMMDTILNLGLNDKSVEGLAKKTSNPRFAYDSYRRLIQMFGNVVLGIPGYEFDNYLERKKEKKNYDNDTDLTVDDLKDIIKDFKALIKNRKDIEFPQKPEEQLLMAIKAVFSSWNNNRAISYRNHNDIPHDLGTAVNVQTMVFGNIGDNSGTGVAFTRNPATGENKVFGEFLLNAQGEDVVAGIRTPKNISELKDLMPEVYEEFMEVTETLEQHYKDMQDIEFTIQEGDLFLLQTRTGKRTADAAINIAVDMEEEGLIDKETAIMRIDPEDISQLLHPNFKEDELEKADLLATGLAASPGAAIGKIYFNSEDAAEAAADGEDVILVRKETSPEDIEGMVKSNGILTSRGGMTSHAAVVARGMGKCCVAGAGDIQVDESTRQFFVDDRVFNEGDYISLNGSTGEVYAGIVETTDAHLTDNFKMLMEWSDEYRDMGVYTNADTPNDAQVAVDFGAEGIGLCRTEHMFFDSERIMSVREMIVADSKKKRKKALDKLFPYQKEDFKGIFKVMQDMNVTVRLLDPPLHEFLPQNERDIKNLAGELSISVEELRRTISDLEEMNPMLGHRGCRLGISYPEIYEMQVKAIISAAIEVKEEDGYDVKADIMIPLVGTDKELEIIREKSEKVAAGLLDNTDTEIHYTIGTMIEIPRAALLADRIAKFADFFSFGTNDLTQMTYGFSRDDAGKFISEYLDQEIFAKDPFQVLDQDGVGKLIENTVKLGREEKPELKIGICGEHGGEPSSIEFCHKNNLNYVSCSPYRVPIARLAAAQSAIKHS
ncbi:pyruvate phosphate dikinase [Halanaerobium congolense]|uniref:Pyruvate, phosphate dikinase n=1 Tax=Halanaerobium congolense TaxID=54121 RepID=A0A1G6PY65_9FIRM|nr:pyruvate, phosphate dikinase [Halanaerobium congolense]PTX15485.1 pyruvate phosphate dikinase [Halanaerobium congolense]TDP21616.1 pyruvate phosphate dikinase [Halanaerobium congolense]TDX44558.1 pyruvate phosphate dikinase [Halanaerobium congolense]SDC85152.1 pyruvate phosphate dikinase [Halanaerobium congolense]SDF04083.1 pyruvate phosphate dikinase [Halanaerobium congolense]